MKKPRLSIIAITFLLVMISAFTFSVVAQAPVWHSADQEVSIVNNDNPPTSITVNHPDNLVSGDLIIVMIFTHDSPGTITCDDAAMTYIGSTTCVEDDGHCSGVAGFWKVATVSEPSGYTFTLTGTPDNDNSQYVKALAGRVTSWTSIGSSSNVYDSNGSPLAIPSIGGLTTPNNFLLVAGFSHHNNIDGITGPSGMTEVYENTSTYASIEADVQSFTNVTSTGDKQYSWTGGGGSYNRAGALMFIINGLVDETDLQISKTVSPGPHYFGALVTFTITVENLGPDNATGVEVSDLLPSGFTYVSHIVSAGLYDSGSGIWNIGTLDYEATATLTITATIDVSGDYENCAEITDSDQPDPVTANNEDCVSITPETPPAPLADLGVLKTVSAGPYYFGNNVTFTITLHNYGPNDATGIYVLDQLQAGFSYVSHLASQGTYNPVNGVWTVGNLANGATVTVTITATIVNNSGPWGNTVSITDADQPDPNPFNNENTLSISPTISPMVPVSNWALYLGIGLIVAFTVIRFRRIL